MLVIRRERLANGWTQEYVATRVGTVNSTIQMIENGQRKPSFDVLVKLEDLFGMDYRDLFNLPQRQLREQQSAPGGNPALDE